MQYRFPTLAWIAGLMVAGCSNDNGTNDGGNLMLDGSAAVDSATLADALKSPDSPMVFDASTTADGSTSIDSTGGLGCCPAGFLLYDCQQPDGRAGVACHNPAMGCASSLTCGQGCDPQVSGRCACVETQLCIAGDHFDRDLCKCVPDRDAAVLDTAPVDTKPRVDTACVDNVLCIRGDHFDTTLCRCVPDAMACSKPTDCSGPLPMLCQQCSDGTSGCAHHACVDGKCTIAYCP